ncbi:hypothetical protein HPP92_028109 [Vanilla planifolia]|uniref:Decapping nuclease n=1 Tax=Vanilla planifolia TaxID=51239 RepID=A0A835P7G2_VANPL|nr:hypothetical protein HPP92_028109 [Vanilla planifolia]KAG0447949.1 hypothetical protein HPP92_028085 [Vanilla planifolia]
MDFSNQDVDVFGHDVGLVQEEDDGEEDQRNGNEEENGSHDTSGSSSLSSSPSSSGSDSSSSSLRSTVNDDYDDGGVVSSTCIRIGYDVVEKEKDLFGEDNEDYVRTPANSVFAVPVLPSLRSTNNQTRANHGRGRSGLLPRPGDLPRQNCGFGKFSVSCRQNDECFVSELRLTKSEETLSRKSAQFQERVENGNVYFDDRSLRLFKRFIDEDIGTDLNRGFESFVEKKDLGSEGFGDLLACIRNSNIPLQNIHFVTYRNNLNKILATAYIRHEPWKMGVHKRNGVVYLNVHKLPERRQSEIDRRRSYWGYAFENLATECFREIGEHGKGIDANVEFCSVIKTKLGAHRIVMGAEMDCCDATDDGRKFYVELKTSRELDHRTEERYERQKLLKFWIQSFLAGVPFIVIGFRNDAGVMVRTERIRTTDITQRVKMKGYWQGGVCLAFADEVFCWLYGTVKENEDYTLQFVHPYKRLELLRAPSCPDAITKHVELLNC